MGKPTLRRSRSMLFAAPTALPALLALILACTLACGYPPADYKDLKEALQDWNQVFKDAFAEGDALFAKGDYDGAIARYDQCLEIAPNNPNALNNRARALYAKGDHAGALSALDAVLAADAANYYALFNRGVVLVRQERWQEAYDAYTALLAKYPGDADGEANRRYAQDHLYVCGDGSCDSARGEDSEKCCKDCPCPAGSYCSPETARCEENPPVCGDGACEVKKGECDGCAKDCSVDACKASGSCNTFIGETCANAPADCKCPAGGICNAQRPGSQRDGCYTVSCGDSHCDAGEDQANCCSDCGCPSGYFCGDGVCKESPARCGDGNCEAAKGECGLCGQPDCSACDCKLEDCTGDGRCTPGVGESCLSSKECACPQGSLCILDRKGAEKGGCYKVACGDGECDKGEDQASCCNDCGCPTDFVCKDNACVVKPPVCGDGRCEERKNETSGSCCRDCGCPAGENLVCVEGRCVAPKDIDLSATVSRSAVAAGASAAVDVAASNLLGAEASFTIAVKATSGVLLSERENASDAEWAPLLSLEPASVQAGKTLKRRVHARPTDVGNKTLFVTLRYGSEGREGEVSAQVRFQAFVCGSGERFCEPSQDCEKESTLQMGDPCACGFQCASGNCEAKRCAEKARRPAGLACETGDDCDSGVCEGKLCVLQDGEPCSANGLCRSKSCDEGRCCPEGWRWVGAKGACADIGAQFKALDARLPLSWDLPSFGLVRSESLQAEHSALKAELGTVSASGGNASAERLVALEARVERFAQDHDRFRMLFYGQLLVIGALVIAFALLARRLYAGTKHPRLQLEALTKSLTGGQENAVELRLQNLGSSPAEAVKVKLLPSAAFVIGQEELAVGEGLAPGLRRDLSIALTPRESGEARLKAEVTCRDAQGRQYYESFDLAFEVSSQVVLQRDIVPSGEHVLFRVKVLNRTDDAIHDVKVTAEVPSVADFVEPPTNVISFRSISGDAAETAVFKVLMRGCAINEMFAAVVTYRDRKNAMRTVTTEVRESIVCPALVPSELAEDYMKWNSTTKRFESRLGLAAALEKVMPVMMQWFKLYARQEGDPTVLLFSGSTKHTRKGYVIYMSVASAGQGSAIDMYAYAEDPAVLTGGIKNVMDGLRAQLG